MRLALAFGAALLLCACEQTGADNVASNGISNEDALAAGTEPAMTNVVVATNSTASLDAQTANGVAEQTENVGQTMSADGTTTNAGEGE